jgi:hypothetical protein
MHQRYKNNIQLKKIKIDTAIYKTEMLAAWEMVNESKYT